jgi:hypothetical protein
MIIVIVIIIIPVMVATDLDVDLGAVKGAIPGVDAPVASPRELIQSLPKLLITYRKNLLGSITGHGAYQATWCCIQVDSR